MKINYANNPLLGTGKWDPLLSLLTPGGDSITVPAKVFNAIRCRCNVMAKKEIAFFQVSKIDGICTISRTNKCLRNGGYKSDLTIKLEKMKVNSFMKVQKSKSKSLMNSSHSLKKKGFGEYRIFRELGKLYVVRTK